MLKHAVRRVTPPPLWVRLRRLRRRWELRTFRIRDERRTFAGVPLTVRLTDPIAEAWYSTEWPPLPEVELLKSGRLRPGARVFNLGAHQAVVALILADAVGPAGQVVAVEATAHNAEVAAANRRLNRADNVVILHAAASASTAPVRFADYFDGFIDEEHGSIVVEAVTVDSLAERFGPPDVVFVDVEGAELRVLEGARETLARRDSDWYVEIHVGSGLERLGGSRESVLATFPDEHYDRHVSFEQGGAYTRFTGEPGVLDRVHALVALARTRS